MSKIGAKFFVIVFSIALGGLLFTSFFLDYSIERKFRDYLYLEKKDKVTNLVELLENDLEESGNWLDSRKILSDFIHTNRMMLVLKDPDGNNIYDPRQGMMGNNSMMMNRMHGMMSRGPGWLNNYDFSDYESEMYPVKIRGKEVAKLYWYRMYDDGDYSQQAAYFTGKVNRAILVAGILVSILTIIISFFVSRYFTRPLLKMNKAAGQVAKGNFSQHMKVKGNDEVAELASAFNKMTEKLSYLEKIRRESTSDLAHELRTPLTTINSYLEAINDGVLIADSKTIGEIQEELQRIIKLVNRLGELAEAEKKMIYMEKTNQEVNSILKNVVNHFIPQVERKNIEISQEYCKNITIQGDQDSLETIFNNLLSNAVKYTPEGGKIKVSVEKNNKNAIIKVKDSGIGIPEKDIPYIFERYYRTDKSRSAKTGGTGIGLTITRELVKVLNGKIEVNSDNKGTEFIIYFPLS